jgi:glycosyltransferase involved in cell wall biosynthesis
MLRISIIIPTYNRPARLASCLESLAQQDLPMEHFEVIVVDDGGQTSLDPVVRPFQDILNISLVKQQNTGPAGARNTGVANASGEFIAFIDDDCAPAEEWLALMTGYLQQDSSRMYGGYTANALEDNIYSSASQALIDFLYGYFNADPQQAHFIASNNMTMARELFETVGGFDTSFPGACGEDRELCDRWLYLDHRITYVPDARIFHSHDLSLRTFWKQHFNYGTGAKRYWECKTRREQASMKVEPLSFYLELISYAWSKKLPHPLPLSFLMLLSQFANTAGFMWAKLLDR